MTLHRAKIVGMGSYTPPRVYTNHDLAEFMDTTHEWIVERTGIEQRHWAEEGDGINVITMAVEAGKKALDNAGMESGDIDMVIFTTLSMAYQFPGGSTQAAYELGIRNKPVFDLRQQCSGFLYALNLANNFIACGQYENVLILSSELHSPCLEKATRGRNVTSLFGDGAGAAILSKSPDESGIITSVLGADGRDAMILCLKEPAYGMGSRGPEDKHHEDYYPHMEGPKVFKHAVTKMPKAIMNVCAAAGVTTQDIDMMIAHQANLRINQMVSKALKVPAEKTHNTIMKYGNTTSASIPMCFVDALENGKIKSGDLVCTVGFGAGLTWGASLMRW